MAPRKDAWEHYFRELVDGKRQRFPDRLLLLLLTGCSLGYAAAMRVRALLYLSGIFHSRKLPRPVISVGNLTVGGTGKTPAVAFIARYFLQRGKRVAVLSRGYGGSLEGEVRIVSDGHTIFHSAAEVGDEPHMLASTVPGLMVVIGSRRFAAGELAMERLKPDIFLLDDGFQHISLRRNLNLLLLDARAPYHNGRVFPAGLLREPVTAEGRADLVIYTRSDGRMPEEATSRPHCRTAHRLTGLVQPGEGPLHLHPFSVLAGQRVLAFAGIGDGAAFFDSLQEAGVPLITTLTFPDHCQYGEEEVAAIVRLRDASRSACLVTTEKDAVKLASQLPRLGTVYAARLEMHFFDSAPLEAVLAQFVSFQE